MTVNYVSQGYDVYFDDDMAKRYLPIVYDPNECGRDEDPNQDKKRGVYYRIMKKKEWNIIQYYYYWPRQIFWEIKPKIIDRIRKILKFKNPFKSIHFPSHKYDYEPIIIFLKNNELMKIAISGKGNTIQGFHEIQIHHEGENWCWGHCNYFTSNKHHWGRVLVKSWYELIPFKFKNSETVKFDDTHIKVSIVDFSHVFSANPETICGKTLKFKLRKLDNDILKTWYEVHQTFGHDVCDPLSFPHIKFSPPPALETYLLERKAKTEYFIESKEKELMNLYEQKRKRFEKF